jgi:cation diffusion facilitator CzcD-associated flavoprotein CzcO
MSAVSVPKVCVIGAGPYGVAVAAHLRYAGIETRAFGAPMRRWFEQMPLTNFLKSEGCASSLPDPSGLLTLPAFCHEQHLAYSGYGDPLSRDTFAKYGIAFQRRLVPHVENVQVTAVKQATEGFEVTLATGESLRASAVVIATGMDCMEYTPSELLHLPRELRSHSADHFDFGQFAGKTVAVIGGGQSGLETAAMLNESGASPTLIVRSSRVIWGHVPSAARRPLYRRLRRPRTNLGDGLQFIIYDKAPQLFHYLPRALRIARVKVELGPAGAWWLRDRVEGKIRTLTERTVRAAIERGGRVALQVGKGNVVTEDMSFDHVIAATGYVFDLQNLPYLDASLKSKLRCEGTTPLLSAHYEASVHGLYFTGIASANSFGPAMRFVVGTGHTARCITAHLSGGRLRQSAFAKQPTCLET